VSSIKQRFSIEPDLVAGVAVIGERVPKVPIFDCGRSDAEGKKIGWKEGTRSLWAFLKYGVEHQPQP